MMAFSLIQESLQIHVHVSQGNVFFLDGQQCGHCNGPNYTFHNMLHGETFERTLPMPVTAVREFLRPKEGVFAISSRYFQH